MKQQYKSSTTQFKNKSNTSKKLNKTRIKQIQESRIPKFHKIQNIQNKNKNDIQD